MSLNRIQCDLENSQKLQLQIAMVKAADEKKLCWLMQEGVSYGHLYEGSSNPFATIRQPHTSVLIRREVTFQ